MADFLEEKRREIQARLKELRPLVEEYHKLEAAEKALAGAMSNGGTTGSGARTTTRRNSAKASPRSRTTSAAPGTRRRGRPKGSGTRGTQAFEMVKERPGITIPELAEAMGIKQNYLYRLMPQLASDGKVKKQGRGWHAK